MKILGRTISRLTLGAIGFIVILALVAFVVNREARTHREARQDYTVQGLAL